MDLTLSFNQASKQASKQVTNQATNQAINQGLNQTLCYSTILTYNKSFHYKMNQDLGSYCWEVLKSGTTRNDPERVSPIWSVYTMK